MTKEELAALYSAGESMPAIARRTGVPLSAVHSAVHTIGVAIRPRARGPAHPQWRGGTYKGKDGYIISREGRVHRLVAERLIGRKLTTWEHAHHVNENRVDNRDENIVVMPKHEHNRFHTFLRHRGVSADLPLLMRFCRMDSPHYFRFTTQDAARAISEWPCPERTRVRMICRIKNCGRQVYAKGRCSKHHQRFIARKRGFWKSGGGRKAKFRGQRLSDST